MKKVYIAHPLRGDVENNVKRISNICRELATQGGVLPLSPIHNFSYMDVTGDQAPVFRLCFSLLSLANELWVYGEWWKSEGCRAEICYAVCRGISIRFKEMNEQLLGGLG